MAVMIRFESAPYRAGRAGPEDGILELGPFDWVEVDGGTMVAESEDGTVRHDELAVLNLVDLCWETEDERRWDYFVICEEDS